MPRSVAELCDQIAAGAAPQYLFFWGHTGSPGRIGKECLSQWHPAPFTVDGERFATAEHYMMFHKARLVADHEAAAHVLSVSHPGHAKRIGREVRGFDEVRWRDARFEIVVAASTAKLSQHDVLRRFLLGARRGTKHRVLVEASPRDRIGGIGLSADPPDGADPTRWWGADLLGFAWMGAREALAGTVGAQ